MPSEKQDDAVERAAMDMLSRQFRPSLTRYFSRRVKESAEIDDLVQEVFVRLSSRARVTDLEQTSGYVFQVANSVLGDWLRRRRVRHAALHDSFGPEHEREEDFAPERVLIGKHRLAQATTILMELPEQTRTIFVLRRLEGMAYKDIGARLDMPVSTLENHMARAMKHLTDRLDEE
jgi:RNA polymerase sigma-70 factor (ECF subfamily)